MIIGVMSDTHGHLTEMRLAARKMVENYGASVIIHLGDDSTDADELQGIASDVISVPGIFEERYNSPVTPKRIIKEFDGISFLLTHTPTSNPTDKPDDIDPTALAVDGDVKVILHGHTHHPEISEKNGAIYINPGHLNPKDNRGDKPSFAIIETNKLRINVKFVSLDGEIFEDKNLFAG